MRLSAGRPERGAGRISRRIGAIVAIALHVAVVVAILSYEPARSVLIAAAPIIVEWITPPKPPEVKPPPPLPKPQPRPVEKPRAVEPQPKPVIQPPPLVTAAPSAPSPFVAPTTPPSAPADPGPVAAAPPAPPAVVPPVFNADYLENPAPPYPTVSRRMGEQGRVVLRVLVSAGGRAEDIQVQTSSGSSRLDESARETVRRWKFVPAKRGNDAISAWVLVPISFRLEG